MAFAGVIFLCLTFVQPETFLVGLFGLLPFGSSLNALRVKAKRSDIWAAVAFNGVWGIFLIGIAGLSMISHASKPLMIALPCLALATLCSFNAGYFFWRVFSYKYHSSLP